MDTAVNMQGDVQVQDDGTWAYTWQWFYAGEERFSDVHEEFVLTDASGSLMDYKKEESHGTEPGQTYIGGGWGNQTLRGGTVNWSLRVIQGDGYLGTTGGSFTAMLPLE